MTHAQTQRDEAARDAATWQRMAGLAATKEDRAAAVARANAATARSLRFAAQLGEAKP